MQTFENRGCKIKWELHTKPSTVEAYFKKANLETLVLDTESVSLDFFSTLLGVSLYDGTHHPIYVAPKTKYWESEVTEKDMREIFAEYLPKAQIIAHNAKYDRSVFKVRDFYHDWNLKDDTSLLIHAYDPDRRKKLEVRVAEDLGYEKMTFDVLLQNRLGGKRPVKWDKVSWDNVVLQYLAEYSTEDVYWTYAIWKKYLKLCQDVKVPDIMYSYEKIEKPLVFTLSDMETRGIRVDVPYLKALGERCKKDYDELTNEVYESLGYVVNLNSPKQISDVLYTKLGLPVLAYTKTGAPSTGADTLKALAHDGYAVAKKLVEHSELDTLRTAFVDKIPHLVDKHGILRCSFNQDITRTGRLSSSGPNLQNQPNNDKYPVRKAYIPREGYTFVVYDYSQIEPRIMAHMSRDPKMLEVFNSGSDIYNGISKELGVERKVSKVIQLATSYGMGADKLAAMLGCSLRVAEEYMNGYKKTYKVYYAWKARVEQEAVRTGYTSTMFGSRRLLPDVRSQNKGIYYSALRKAVNTPVQGSAAQIIKKAMNRTNKGAKKLGWDLHVLLSVHDELVIEVRNDLVSEAVPWLMDIAETTVRLDVPIVAEYKVCTDWSQMKDKGYEGNVYEYIKPCMTPGEMLMYGIL